LRTQPLSKDGSSPRLGARRETLFREKHKNPHAKTQRHTKAPVVAQFAVAALTERRYSKQTTPLLKLPSFL